MSDSVPRQQPVSLQRQVMDRFREAMDADSDVSARAARLVWEALESGPLDRDTLVQRVMDEILDAPTS